MSPPPTVNNLYLCKSLECRLPVAAGAPPLLYEGLVEVLHLGHQLLLLSDALRHLDHTISLHLTIITNKKRARLNIFFEFPI